MTKDKTVTMSRELAESLLTEATNQNWSDLNQVLNAPTACRECIGTGGIGRLETCEHCNGTGKIAAPVVEPDTYGESNLCMSCGKHECPGCNHVVERQPVAYLDIGAGGYMDLGSDLTDEQLQALPNGRHMLGIVGTYGIDGWKPALAFSTGHPDPVAYATFDDGGKIKIWSRSAKVVEDIARHGEKGIPLYTAPPELAELQANIARLTAENERLKDGQGEPVAYADPKSFENFKNLAHLGGLYAHEWMWANPAPGLKPLYTSQPAPVSVGWIYEDGKEFTRCADHAHDLMAEGIELTPVYACLDKVKELNQ